MPSIKELSNWITESIPRSHGLFCSIFIEENRPHVKVLCVTPGKQFDTRVLTYLKNVAMSDVASVELAKRFETSDRIHINIVFWGIYEVDQGDFSPTKRRREFSRRLRQEMISQGYSDAVWFDSIPKLAIETGYSLQLEVFGNRVTLITPSSAFESACSSKHQLNAELLHLSEKNSGYFEI